MARKRKKKKKPVKKIDFSQIIQLYKLGQYEQVLSLLKRTSIHPDYAGYAKQIKVNAVNHVAFKQFQEYKFKHALELLKSNLGIQPRAGYPLSIDKTNILIGLCYLYMDDFEQASQKLDFTQDGETPNIQNFYFYFLLAQLYRKEYNDLRTAEKFMIWHEDYVENLSEAKKQYLKAIFYFAKEQEADFLQLLENIRPDSHFQHNNINALKHFFGSDKVEPFTTSKLKPIYKVLTGVELTEEERAMLLRYPELIDLLKKRNSQANHFKIQKELHRLCTDGLPMSRWAFGHIMENEELREVYPTLVYNQVAALYNQGVEQNEEVILEIIKTYWEDFFEVPESMMLYLNALIKIEDRPSESVQFFFQILQYYFTNLQDSLQSKQINRISFLVCHIVMNEVSFYNNSNAYQALNLLTDKYPSAIGFKYIQIWAYALGYIARPRNEMFQIFSLPNISNASFSILHNTKMLLESVAPGRNMFMFLFENNFQDYERAVVRLVTEFTQAVQQNGVHSKAKSILSLFEILAKHLTSLVIEHEQKIHLKIINNFKNVFKEQLILWEENQPDSPYQLAYQSLFSLTLLAQLTQLIRKKNERQFKKLFIKSIDDQSDNFIINYLQQKVDESEDEDVIFALTTCLTTYALQQPNQLLNKLTDFYQTWYKRVASSPFVLFAPTRQQGGYLQLLEHLLKQHKTEVFHRITYYLAALAVKPYTQFVAPIYYNFWGRFLEFMQRILKKNPDFAYEEAFIHEVMLFVEKAVNERKLKGLGKKLQTAIAFFGKPK